MSRVLDSLPFADGHPIMEFLKTLDSEESRRTQLSALRRCCALIQGRETPLTSFDWHRVTPSDLGRLRARLVELYKPATGRRYLAAVRGVLESCYVSGLLAGDDYMRLVHRRALRPIRGESAPPGRALAPEEAAQLLAACRSDRSHRGARDAALLAVLYGAGLRRIEAVGLDLADVDLSGRTLAVVGKGRKERVVPCPKGTADAIRDWLEVRGTWPGPLFVPLGREGAAAESRGRRISASAVRWVLGQRAHEAGLTRRLSVHDLRRTYVSDLLDDPAMRLDTVARLAGHRKLDTTMKYDRHGEERARLAGERRDVPYVHVSRPSLQPLRG